RRVSSEKTSRHLARARRLVSDMPHLHRAKQTARVPEETTTAITSILTATSPELRAQIDQAIAGSEESLARLDGLGTEKIQALVREEVQARSTREETVERAEIAAQRRHLRFRALPDGMARGTGVLPAYQAAQIEAVVQAAAESERAAGSPTPIGALRADMLHEAVMRFHDATVFEPDDDLDHPTPKNSTARGVLVEDDLPTSIGSGAFGPLGTGKGPGLNGPPPRLRR